MSTGSSCHIGRKFSLWNSGRMGRERILVPSKDVDALASKLNVLIDNPGVRVSMGKVSMAKA